jgi:hypothetical protein
MLYLIVEVRAVFMKGMVETEWSKRGGKCGGNTIKNLYKSKPKNKLKLKMGFSFKKGIFSFNKIFNFFRV